MPSERPRILIKVSGFSIAIGQHNMRAHLSRKSCCFCPCLIVLARIEAQRKQDPIKAALTVGLVYNNRRLTGRRRARDVVASLAALFQLIGSVKHASRLVEFASRLCEPPLSAGLDCTRLSEFTQKNSERPPVWPASSRRIVKLRRVHILTLTEQVGCYLP